MAIGKTNPWTEETFLTINFSRLFFVGSCDVKGFFRSLLLLAGLACLPACAASEGMTAQQPSATSPSPSPALLQPAAPPTVTSRSVSVHFDKNSADIRAAAMQILYGAALESRGHRITAIRVIGHADANGRRAYNQRLSEQRAASVADQLNKLGLRAERIEVVGAGEAAPQRKGKKRIATAEDRRVEIIIEMVAEQTAALAPPSAASLASASPANGDAAAIGAVTIAPHAPQQIAVAAPVWLQPLGKPAIKRNFVAPGTTWLPPPAA